VNFIVDAENYFEKQIYNFKIILTIKVWYTGSNIPQDS